MKPFALMLIASLVAGNAYSQTQEIKDTNKVVIAVVLGKNITINDKVNLRSLISKPLMEQFIKDNNLGPTEREINACLSGVKELQRQQVIKLEQESGKLLTELKDTSLSKQERSRKESDLRMIEKMLKSFSGQAMKEQASELDTIELQVIQRFILNWKVNKALYEKYGGRIVSLKFGPEAFDASRDFLREQEKTGAFRILDKECESSFWEYYTSEKHRFYNKEEGEKFINTPFWMMKLP